LHEVGATILIDLFSTFSSEESDFDVGSVLKTLHEEFPSNFPITVQYCRNALLEGEFDQSNVLVHREFLSLLNTAIKAKQDKKEVHKYKYILHTSNLASGQTKAKSVCQYICMARFVVLQYFEKTENSKFLAKTFEYSVKEIISNFGAKETAKFIIRYIEEILLKRKLIANKE